MVDGDKEAGLCPFFGVGVRRASGIDREVARRVCVGDRAGGTRAVTPRDHCRVVSRICGRIAGGARIGVGEARDGADKGDSLGGREGHVDDVAQRRVVNSQGEGCARCRPCAVRGRDSHRLRRGFFRRCIGPTPSAVGVVLRDRAKCLATDGGRKRNGAVALRIGERARISRRAAFVHG